jgi:predicted N-acetyltransferase YhbS
MSAAVVSESSLSYELLLKKTEEPCRASDEASTVADESSTVEADSPSSASVNESLASAMRPAVGNTMVLRNVSHSGPQKEPRMEALIRQTRELSEVVFDEDALKEVTKKTRWRLSLLITTDYSVLCGFAITRVTNGALSIAKIAVPMEFRGLGFGKTLMEDAIKTAKRDHKELFEVCLSSLSTAVTFYQRIGFKALTGVKVKTDFEVVEGQVYMVKKIGKRPKGK